MRVVRHQKGFQGPFFIFYNANLQSDHIVSGSGSHLIKSEARFPNGAILSVCRASQCVALFELKRLIKLT